MDALGSTRFTRRRRPPRLSGPADGLLGVLGHLLLGPVPDQPGRRIVRPMVRVRLIDMTPFLSAPTGISQHTGRVPIRSAIATTAYTVRIDRRPSVSCSNRVT